MNFIIRREIESDYDEVEYLTTDAFWDIYKPGCVEHLLAHKLRKIPAFIPELDFVAVMDDQIVGNIMYSRAIVADESGSGHEVLTFGPLSVLPAFQKKRIGSALVEHTKKLAATMGWKAIIIYGNPNFYCRFGFEGAERFNLSTADGQNFVAFMALELYKDALCGITGRFREDPVFQIDEDELESFEKRFPYREKHVTDTQLK